MVLAAAPSDITSAELVRVAEENDLIARLGRQVLFTACSEARVLQRAYPDRVLMLCVNVSGLELIGDS